MIHIKLENINRSQYKELYLGTRSRLATATSISFLDSNTFVAASLVGMKLYLYQFNFTDKSYKLIDSLDTTYNGKLCLTDLADYYNNLIVCSNFELGTQTIYKCENNKLSHYLDIKPFHLPQFCHGVKFYKSLPNTICATGNKLYCIDFINYVNQELLYRINLDIRPQDIAIISENRIAILGSMGNVTDKVTNNPIISVKLMYYDIDIHSTNDKSHKLLDTCILDNYRGDSIIYFENKLYFTDQNNDNVVIVKVENDKLTFDNNISLFDFPHGLSIEPINRLLGVTNYGDNSIIITSL